MLDSSKAAILSVLASQPGQPRKVLRRDGPPCSEKWCYSPGPRAPLMALDDRDVRQLYVDGYVQFLDDESGQRCAVLNQSKAQDALSAATAWRDQEIRRRATPYTFEQLLNRQVHEYGPDLVLHPHVPKLGGITVAALLRQIDFFTLHFDMSTLSFFDSVPEDRFFDAYRAPPPRRAYALTGHYRLDHPLLRRLWMPHVIVTTLRDPVNRLLSHYNHTLLVKGSPWHDDVVRGMPFAEYARNAFGAFGAIYSFFDDTGQGTFAPTGTGTAQECLRNLVTRVGLFGLTERFDQFAVLVGYLLGKPGVAVVSRNVTDTLPNPDGVRLKRDVSAAEHDDLADLLKDDLWFYREAVKEYERRVSDPRLQQLFSEALPLFRTYLKSVQRFAALRDPGNPRRGAFDSVRAPLYSAEHE